MSICTKDLAALEVETSGAKQHWSNSIITLLSSTFPNKPYIPTGLDRQGLIDSNRDTILNLLSASKDDWLDWRWQIDNRIESVDLVKEVLNLSDDDISFLSATENGSRWSITPYYLSLMSPDPNCPIRIQVMPTPGTSLKTVYPEVQGKMGDSAVIMVASRCATKCQYCTFCKKRKGAADETNHIKTQLTRGIDHLKTKPGRGEVIITGGDPLLLDNSMIDWLLTELTNIPFTSSIRIESRALATLPQRITPDLTRILSKDVPVSITTHFNSPLEVTREASEACMYLRDAGISLENQAVHLVGVNDKKYILKRLNDALRQMGFTPRRKRWGQQVRRAV